jgi:thiol-disulfide isomerase/thioredoxin
MASRKSKLKHHVDVRSGADILGLNELLKKKKNNTIIVLIYADFCGHCTTFKNDVWKHLGAMPNRNAGLVSIHHDQVENTPFAAKTINGYPTVFQLKKGQTPEKAEEVKDIRNMEMMKSLAQGDSESPEEEARNEEVQEEAEIINNLSSKSNKNNSNSPRLDSESSKLRNTITKNKVASLLNLATNSVTKPLTVIPNLKSDVLNSQGSAESIEFNSSSSKKSVKDEKIGGSLYASLLEASKIVAPAALLTGAVALSKRKKTIKTKRASKRSKRKNTRKAY